MTGTKELARRFSPGASRLDRDEMRCPDLSDHCAS